MKFKAIAAFALAVLMALPASAASPAATDVGVFDGAATVGDARDGCTNEGVSAVTGNGLGLLSTGVHYYSINAPGSVTSVAHGTGTLNLCGVLNPTGGAAGASCVTTNGTDGKGRATFGGADVYLDNVGWAATLGGTFVVTGEASGTASKVKSDDPSQTLVAVVQALDRNIVQDCLGDVATTFDVRAVYAIA